MLWEKWFPIPPIRTATILVVLYVVISLSITVSVYRTTKNVIIENAYNSNLQIAQSIEAQVGSLIQLYKNDSAKFMPKIVALWKKINQRKQERFLCIIDKNGTVLLHSDGHDKQGLYLGKNKIPVNSESIHTVADLIAHKQNWAGYITDRDIEQAVAYVYSHDLPGLIAIHVLETKIAKDVSKSLFSWIVGFLVSTTISSS